MNNPDQTISYKDLALQIENAMNDFLRESLVIQAYPDSNDQQYDYYFLIQNFMEQMNEVSYEFMELEVIEYN